MQVKITSNKDIRTSKSSVALACFLPARAKDLSAPLYISNAVRYTIYPDTVVVGQAVLAVVTSNQIQYMDWLKQVSHAR